MLLCSQVIAHLWPWSLGPVHFSLKSFKKFWVEWYQFEKPTSPRSRVIPVTNLLVHAGYPPSSLTIIRLKGKKLHWNDVLKFVHVLMWLPQQASTPLNIVLLTSVLLNGCGVNSLAGNLHSCYCAITTSGSLGWGVQTWTAFIHSRSQ